MAEAQIAASQTTKARNHLKFVLKQEWDWNLANEFERGWLLLADLYIQGNKFDLATELLKKCLVYNASCNPAHELLGSCYSLK